MTEGTYTNNVIVVYVAFQHYEGCFVSRPASQETNAYLTNTHCLQYKRNIRFIFLLARVNINFTRVWVSRNIFFNP